MMAAFALQWTPVLVEERLIEAILVFAREPDRERGWLHVGSNMPDYVYSKEDWGNWTLAAPPRQTPSDAVEVDRAEATLGWLSIPSMGQRLVMRPVLIAKSLGKKRIPWDEIRKTTGWGKTSKYLLKSQYRQGIQAIVKDLNEPEIKDVEKKFLTHFT